MADQDAGAALGQRSERLLEMMVKNRDLTNAFMAMLWIIANTAAARGTKMDGIKIGAVTMTENRMRAHVNFHSVSLAGQRHTDVEALSLADHIGRENNELWVFIRANPDIPKMLRGFIEKMDAYARDKGARFADLAFTNGFMDNEDCFVLVLQNPKIAFLSR